MDDTYIIKKEYGAGSQYRTRNPKLMSFVSYQTALLRSVGPKTGGRKKKVEYKSLPCLDKQME